MQTALYIETNDTLCILHPAQLHKKNGNDVRFPQTVYYEYTTVCKDTIIRLDYHAHGKNFKKLECSITRQYNSLNADVRAAYIYEYDYIRNKSYTPNFQIDKGFFKQVLDKYGELMPAGQVGMTLNLINDYDPEAFDE